MQKFNVYFLGALFSLFVLLAFYTFDFQSDKNFSSLPTPEINATEKFDYYIISDETDTKELMRVSMRVYIGDEVLAEDNSLYRIVKIEGNHAFARYVKKIHL